MIIGDSMHVFYILIIIFIILCFLLIWLVSTYNRFQSYIIRINEAENFIDNTLRKRYDLLNKSINIIKKHTKEKGNILESIDKMKSKNLSNFELDRQLYEAINEFNKYKENEELNSKEEFLKIDLGLFESESEIVAARKYYNDIITDYNKLTSSFPNNIVAIIFKYKKKTYYDGKDLDNNDSLKI
ncbi:MAG: LemA family protein [Lactobacillales bacterium]|nr:LemA family protein [Lactobacillales bacterium]